MQNGLQRVEMETGRIGGRMSRPKIQVTRDTSGCPLRIRSSPPRFSVPFPKSIPGGAKQTEGEGGVSQLLKQLGEKMCASVSRILPLP